MDIKIKICRKKEKEGGKEEIIIENGTLIRVARHLIKYQEN